MRAGKCLDPFGGVQVFQFCFHSDSGLSYSAHQHVWQYRDTALAWRRLQPSVLLNDRKEESGFARTWKTQDCFLKTVVLVDICVPPQKQNTGYWLLRTWGREWGVGINGHRTS